MKSEGRKLGDQGEEAARDHLVKLGFEILGSNYSKRFGELDIIAEKDGAICFVEVKTSWFHPDSAFTPELRINAKKVRNLKRICETYLRENNVSPEKPWQIDVISVILDEDGALKELNHIENAVFEKKY